MFRVGTVKTIGRVASLVFLIVTMLGPWFADGHPSTQENCSDPFIWLGNGYCACLLTFKGYVEYSISGENALWFLCLPPALPVLSTLLLILFGEHRWLRVCHLSAWGIAGIYALLWFGGVWYAHQGVLILWGAGLGSLAAIAALVVEILFARRQVSRKHLAGWLSAARL